MTATRDQIKAAFSSGEKLYQAKIAQVSQALQQATQEGDALRRRGDELAGQVHELRDELERQRARGGARPRGGEGTRPRGRPAPGRPRAARATTPGPGGGTARGGRDPGDEADAEAAMAHRDIALNEIAALFERPR